MEVTRAAGGMSRDFTLAAGAIGAALTSVVAGTAALMDNVSQADLGYQVFARRMFMSADAAKQLKIATDALGYSLEDIIWGPKELGDRYRQLIKDQQQMSRGLGGEDFETQMRKLRDLRFEFTRFKVEIQYAAMGLTRLLSRALFGDDDALLKKLRAFNAWFIENLPQISQKISQHLLPALKDIMAIGKDIWGVIKDVLSAFISFTGQIAGIDKLKSGEVTIEHLAEATERWVKALRNVVDLVKSVWDAMILPPDDMPDWARKLFSIPSREAIQRQRGGPDTNVPANLQPYLRPMSSSSSNDAASEAARIGALTGMNPRLIYEQWAHETGNFRSELATMHHNLAGIKTPGGAGYRDFGSVGEFADYYAKLLSEPRFSGLKGAMNEEQWAAILKSGRYMEDSAGNYARGMRRFRIGPEASPTAYRGGDTHVGGVTVHVTQPNATAHEIASAVGAELHRRLGRQTQEHLVQFQEVYT